MCSEVERREGHGEMQVVTATVPDNVEFALLLLLLFRL
jgi:hypothetical protein